MEERALFLLSLRTGQKEANLWTILRRPTRRARASAKAGGRECGGACGKCQPLPGRGAGVRAVMTLVSQALSQCWVLGVTFCRHGVFC